MSLITPILEKELKSFSKGIPFGFRPSIDEIERINELLNIIEFMSCGPKIESRKVLTLIDEHGWVRHCVEGSPAHRHLRERHGKNHQVFKEEILTKGLE